MLCVWGSNTVGRDPPCSINADFLQLVLKGILLPQLFRVALPQSSTAKSVQKFHRVGKLLRWTSGWNIPSEQGSFNIEEFNPDQAIDH